MRPPRVAEYLLRICTDSRDREALLGDLQEEFGEHISPERGRLKAAFWYWRQTLATLKHTRLPPRLFPREEKNMIWTHLHELRFAARRLSHSIGFTVMVAGRSGTGDRSKHYRIHSRRYVAEPL